MNSAILFTRKLQKEYNRARKILTRELRKRRTPEDTKILFKTAINDLTARQSKIIAYYIAKAFFDGKKAAEREVEGILIKAAAAEVGFNIFSIEDPKLRGITHDKIGHIGKYNVGFDKALAAQYDKLFQDNKLLESLHRDGWTPWLGETLKQRGIDPRVINLVKNQRTSAKMLEVLNQQGIRGGMHPDQVGRRMIPFVNRYFGPKGVEIDNVGKKARRLHVDADGNYKWRMEKIKKKYRATPKTYSRLIARDSITTAHRDAYYESLEKTHLVDHYISVAVFDARTCANCAMMHGRTVTHADGPQYHGNCHCDLKPVWRSNTALADKNKSESVYAAQRDQHFMHMNDLTIFNKTMPRGEKVKNFALLPRGASTHIMPGSIKMRAIRHAVLGSPRKIAVPSARKPTTVPIDDWAKTDDEWRAEADALWKKTAKDGNEHMRVYNGLLKEYNGDGHSVSFNIPPYKYSTLHTHPSWDSPLSAPDMTGFLSSRNELVCAATSKKNIYVIRKTSKTERISVVLEKKVFTREYNDVVKRLTKTMLRQTGLRYPDMTKVHLKAGKEMAERYGFEYKVIKRKP